MTINFPELIKTIEGAAQAFGKGSGGIFTGIAQGVHIVSGVVQEVAPNLTVAGVPVAKVLGIAAGIAEGAPDIVHAYNSVKAAVEGGAEPTPEQWAELDAAADKAHADLQAAIAAYAAGQ